MANYLLTEAEYIRLPQVIKPTSNVDITSTDFTDTGLEITVPRYYKRLVEFNIRLIVGSSNGGFKLRLLSTISTHNGFESSVDVYYNKAVVSSSKIILEADTSPDEYSYINADTTKVVFIHCIGVVYGGIGEAGTTVKVQVANLEAGDTTTIYNYDYGTYIRSFHL
jgi:hypothetical protein